MVVRSDQRRRKRDGSDAPTVATPPAPTDDNEKRTKVHAQRKFAQGAALSSPALTPVKDKSKANGSAPEPLAEMTPAKRPKTTDFLTFLCLRGSSFLPARLNFFNTPATGTQEGEPAVNGHGPSKYPSSKQEKVASDGPSNRKVKEVVKASKAAPAASSTVQALKKKYQEQRLISKTRSGVLNKLAQKVKDKNLTRARAAAPVEKQPAPKKRGPPGKPAKVVKTKPVVKASPVSSTRKARRSTRSSGVAVDSTPLVLPVTKRKKLNGRIGLRSGGRAPAAKELPKTKRPKLKSAQEKSKHDESESELESEDEKPVAKKPKPAAKVEKKLPLKKAVDQVAKKRLQLAKTAQQRKALLQTRSKAPVTLVKQKGAEQKRNTSPKPTPRLSRKTKEAATIYMELLGKKWMSPGDEDDEDDDAISLYSFPELRRQSVDKNTPGNKRKAEDDTELLIKADKDVQKKVPVKEKVAEKPKVAAKIVPKGIPTRQSTSIQQKSLPKKPIEKKKSEPDPTPAPLVPRKSTRASFVSDPIKFSDSEDEMLDSKMKKVEEKKKLTKIEKEKPSPKQSLASIKKAKLNSDKIKAQSMSQLVRFTKKKFLNVRKSTEACIQELVASTLERLNKQEEEEADEIDLDLIDEPVIQKSSKEVEKKKDQVVEKAKEVAKKKEPEGKKVAPKLGKDLVAKKSASYVPAPAKKIIAESSEKFYAKKTAAIYPPSPAKLKKLAKGAEKETRRSVEQRIAPKPTPEKQEIATRPDQSTPMKAVQLTQTGEISGQNFVMINSTNQDLVLIPSASTSTTSSPGKYIVCRKEAIVTSTGGVQYMMVPTDKVVLPMAPVPTAQPQEVKKANLKKPEQPKQEEPKKVKASSSTQLSASAQANKKPSSPDKGEKKAIFQRVRPEKVEKAKNTPKSVSAFCPENESSVYDFDTDPEDVPTSPPFRQKKKDEPSPTAAFKHSSIAVQVNFDESASSASDTPKPKAQPAGSKKAEPQAGKSNDRLFFIPIQPGVSNNQQIQGVEVKVGTDGPNQRVVMQAKLVTNTPGTFAAPLNTTGLVRSSQHPAATVGKSSPKSTPTKSVLVAQKVPAKSAATPSPASTSKSSTVPTPKSSPQVQTPKAQQVAAKRQSTDSSTPSTSATKSAPKKQVLQRQGSLGGSSKDSKASRLFDPQSTPNKFPTEGSCGSVLEAPVFYPTEKEFHDPLEYIEKISSQAEQFGICRIVPPSTFKPECKVSDDMRFMAYNQYVHKMVNRWGPNAKETAAIKKLLKKQNVSYTHPPWIGGMEIDLSKFSQTVQSLGGLKGVIEKKRWQKVADAMKIPKSAQDRVTKLDDIYCQFLLAFDTLSQSEKQELLDEVQTEWDKKQSDFSSDDEENFDENEECITKGRNMPLSAFYRIARNTMSMWFKNPEPAPSDVEAEYWRITRERTNHVCVHSGSIDSGVWGYGFPTNKNSSGSKHPWNLKVLSNNNSTILRSMGSVMGVTVPTLHVGMLFSTFCWYRDPHGLPWIEYLHTGASKIWYGIPNSNSASFKNAMRSIVPKYCRDKNIWLPSDTAMVPPEQLISHGVSLCRTVQEPGQFILIFPKAFTSSVCTGYLVSESVYFAQPRWLKTAEAVFKELKDSNEPTMFSLERLLFSLSEDNRCGTEVLKLALPLIRSTIDREERNRDLLKNVGLKSSERLPLPDTSKKARSNAEEDTEYECEVCRANLYLSLVTNSQEEAVYCLPHAISLLNKKKHQLKYSKLLYTYDMDELNELMINVEDKIESKGNKKSAGK